MHGDDNILQKLAQLDKKYNLYVVSKEEAIALAKPLIKQYNEKVKELAVKYGMRPKLLSIKKFNFGR